MFQDAFAWFLEVSYHHFEKIIFSLLIVAVFAVAMTQLALAIRDHNDRKHDGSPSSSYLAGKIDSEGAS
ncbi:MAG TPA: hypothetical protein VK963_03295 [Candidatus Saccharimonadales bacterium]|nr:hypothetical protein [Candidatus Saccharimonadales bacterium]